MSFKIVRNDITKMNTEAIVNTANARAIVGTGCDSAIYNAAGYDELLAYRKEKIGAVPEGEAFITPGFNLKAEYIIHAVSPMYINGDSGEEVKLRSCYRKSLQLAREYSIRTIAFPLISTGGFGYPKEEGLRIAVDEINSFLDRYDMQIYLVVFDDKTTALGEKIYPDLEEYIDQNYVESKRNEEYGDALSESKMAFSNAVLADRTPCKREERPGRGLRDIFKKPSSKSSIKKDTGYADFDECEEDSDFPDSTQGISGNETFGAALFAAKMPESPVPFGEEHESRLEERIKHLSDTFSQYLLYLIQDKNMENAEVYKRAIVDKKTFSKIKNNVNYHPQKLTALCLCVGAKLNLDESKDLLARAGYALSPCDMTDIIFSYFIENEIYDMIELDIQLEEHGLPCIIS